MRVVSCLLVALFATAVIVSASTPPVPQSVADGFFAGRSGHAVIYKNNQLQNDESMVSFVFMNDKFYIPVQLPSQLSLYDIAPTVSHMFGLPSANAAKPKSLLTVSAFSRPAANLLFTVDGVGKSELNQYNLNNLREIMQTVSATISNMPYPHQPLSTSVSLTSGVPPSSHGIVGESWFEAGQRVDAFTTSAAQSQVASLPDLFSQAFEGKSLTVSFSGAYLQAVAHCTHRALRDSHPEWTNLCLAYDRVNGQISAIDRRSKLDFTQQAVEEALSSSSFANQLKENSKSIQTVQYNSATHRLVVGLSNQGKVESVEFDLNSESVRTFFAELVFLQNLPSTLKHQYSSFVSDNVPDFYALSVHGLNGITNKYSAGSAQHIAALHLLDAAVPALLQNFKELYAGNFLPEVVLLSAANNDQSAAQLARNLEQSFTPKYTGFHSQQFPSLHASITKPQLQSFCNELNNQVAPKGYSVLCAQPSSFAEMSFRLMDVPDAVIEPDLYQIFLWLSIGLAATVYAAVYSIVYMDNKKDTLLYSKFNPQVGRKA